MIIEKSLWGKQKRPLAQRAGNPPLPESALSGYKAPMRDQWAEISENLKKMLDSGVFKVWIAPLRARLEDGALCLAAPNAFMAGWLESRMLCTLREAAAPVLGLAPEAVDLRIEIAGNDRNAAPEAASTADLAARVLPRRQASLPMPAVAPAFRREAAWRYRFEDFVVGPSNSVAVAAAQDVCRSGGDVRTLFVNSASGLGKTHLAQAVGQSLSRNSSGARVAYLTAEEFASRFVAALRSHDVEAFKGRLRELDVLLLEDVHFFQGKEKMPGYGLGRG